MLAICVATLATNIAANVVSPANDFAHLAPRRITFRVGGLITGLIGIAMMPWKLLADPSGYIFTWLVGYSALLGPIGGILIADYVVHRRGRLSLRALYRSDGEYRYLGGVSRVALVALTVAVLPSLPGFLVQVQAIRGTGLPAFLLGIYDYAWFAGFGLAFAVYLLLRRLAPRG
jgi:NCS1 family nucleobase:cation symporter-1